MSKPDLMRVLLDISLIVGLARLMGALLRRCGQPAVVGEIIAGILLGPSVLGVLAPGAFAYLFAPTVQPYLFLLAQIGLIFFMFLVGLGVDPAELRARLGLAGAISGVSILAPLALGAALALGLLYPLNGLPDVSPAAFAVFIGAAMSITAFPVLARMVGDLRLDSRLPAVAGLALATASIDDLAAWCLLALAIALGKSQGLVSALPTIAAMLAFALAMATVGRLALGALLARFPENAGPAAERTLFTGLYAVVVLGALCTEWIGIDVIFGGFLVGAVLPKGRPVLGRLKEQTENFIATFLLPIFFAYSGLNTKLGLLDTPRLWLVCLAVIGVAVLGKFAGVYLVARLGGLPRREAGVLGWLMNTRGLTELIILNIALGLGVISPTLFTIFVLMALATTMMATPLIERLLAGAVKKALR